MSDKTVNLIIWMAVLLLSAALARVALANDLWRSFWVTEVQLVVTAIVLSVVLRSGDQKK